MQKGVNGRKSGVQDKFGCKVLLQVLERVWRLRLAGVAKLKPRFSIGLRHVRELGQKVKQSNSLTFWVFDLSTFILFVCFWHFVLVLYLLPAICFRQIAWYRPFDVSTLRLVHFSTFRLFDFSTFLFFDFSAFQLFDFSIVRVFDFSTFQILDFFTIRRFDFSTFRHWLFDISIF